MSILVDKNTKVIVQGLTGKTGGPSTPNRRSPITAPRWSAACTRPRAARLDRLDGETLPIFASVAEARDATGADASVIYVPPAGAADAIIEAIDAEIPFITCITEGIPVLDMVQGQARGWRARSRACWAPTAPAS